MVKSLTQRRRGKRRNPNWGQPGPIPRAAATEFEVEVRRLGLTGQTCASSSELRRWCEVNKKRCYIPEWLLEAWRIDVDANING
jgi:hypothetical protein